MTRWRARAWAPRCLNCHIGVRRGCVCWECLRAALVPVILAELARLAFRWLA